MSLGKKKTIPERTTTTDDHSWQSNCNRGIVGICATHH